MAPDATIVTCIHGHPIDEGETQCEHGHSPTPSSNPVPSSDPSSSSVPTLNMGTMTLTPELLQQILTMATTAQTQAALNTQAPAPQRTADPAPAPRPNPEKPKRPTISAGTSLEKWDYFITKWSRYKKLSGISTDHTVGHLLECCDDDLQLDLYRCAGSEIENKNEKFVLDEIKRLAIREENTLISRIILRGMTQGPDEDIKHFAARVKGQAEICKYSIKCTKEGCNTVISYSEAEIKDQLCKGLSDLDIQQELLGHENMTLNETIKFISAKEIAKKSQGALSNQNSSATSLNKISPYQRNKMSPTNNETKGHCGCCGKTGHGTKPDYGIRKKSCPAFGKTCGKCNHLGHFDSMCRTKNLKSHSAKNDSKIPHDANSNSSDPIEPIYLGAVGNKSVATNNSKVKPNSMKKIAHTEHDKNNGWIKRHSKNDPIVKVEVSVCRDANGDHNSSASSSRTITKYAIADTGARTTVSGINLVRALGLKEDDLIPVQQQLCGANGSNLDILGGLFLSFKSTDKNGITWETKQLVYIQKDNAERIYLSRCACEQLGIIKENFPQIGDSKDHTLSINATHDDPENICNCPQRSKAPSAPSSLPFPATDDNREKLEQWLLNHYKSSTFNICEHQPLPLMPGPPLQLMIEPNATPHAVHTPIPVPVHWQKQVKAGLDRDVRLGVIEPVPWGTPTTWCSRMVTVPKKDGTPRRTVDLQPLNAVSARQTHHTPSPFHQAASVPHHTKKTVCDAWNGYHSVAIREEDRDLTTFITPWGRYRYCSAPQGYLAAGDAYTRRFDELISDINNKTKCVDDTLLWSNSIESSFHQACEFLSLCGNNGITLNPKKFHFAKDDVEFAGFEITPTSVRPCKKYLQAISEFPTPTDITGIRSWFGLVNQVSYAFSMTERMSPFRELLKPGNKFYWDSNLQHLFDESKNKIVQSVQDGVRIFDSSRLTCLTTDWSKIGTGFLLTQKHCSCQDAKPDCCHDGWKLIFAGSKFNSPAEANYAAVEGECLAVVKGLQKTRYFVLGCKDLIIATDHKPLLKILGDRCLEDIQNSRLLNLKEKTLRYKYTIVHVSGKRNQGPDAVSRYPISFSSTNRQITSVNKISSSDDIWPEIEQYTQGVAVASLSSIDNLKSVTWDRVREATLSDPNMLDLLHAIQDGGLTDKNTTPSNLHEYQRFWQDLSTVDTVILYKERVVIPPSLRPEVLENLHAAHQGITSMTARADTSVFWPGIHPEITQLRLRCSACNKMAPSQPDAPPKALIHPEYPFQYICADYFNYKGVNYLVIVDRYSNWPAVMRAKQGEGAKELIAILKGHCETFGIPEEISSDGGPQFTSSEMKKFMNEWGIRARISSMAFPHSNCRAELGVKSMKRLITNNVGAHGSLNTDLLRRAMLQYKNTPDPDTKLSPAQIVFGRVLRDFTPVTPNNYKPAANWTLTSKNREAALTKRHARTRESLSLHTRNLPPLTVGDTVYLQNQVGNYPRRWDRSGTVVEVKQYDQYNIKIDGSGRLTLRNRKFLRKFTPFHPLQRKMTSCPSRNTPTPQPTSVEPNDEIDLQTHTPLPVAGDIVSTTGNSRSSLETRATPCDAPPPRHHEDTQVQSPGPVAARPPSSPGSPGRPPASPITARSEAQLPDSPIVRTPAEVVSPSQSHPTPVVRRSNREKKPNPKYSDYVCGSV